MKNSKKIGTLYFGLMHYLDSLPTVGGKGCNMEIKRMQLIEWA